MVETDMDIEDMIKALNGYEKLSQGDKDHCFYYNADILNQDGSFPYISYLEVEGKWKSSYLNLLKKNNIEGLSLDNSIHEGTCIKADFFNKLPPLKLLMLSSFYLDKNFHQLDGFSSLKNLEVLVLTASLPKQPIDFGFFQKLKECELFSGSQTGSIGLDKDNKSIFSCLDLEKLSIHEYKDDNFDGFEKLLKLKYLSLTARMLKNFNGIERLQNLLEIELINSTFAHKFQ